MLFRQPRHRGRRCSSPAELDAIDREVKDAHRRSAWPRPRRRRMPTEADLLTDVYASY